MATNLQGTRPTHRSGDTTVIDPTPTPVVNPTGVGGVAVYDRDVDHVADPALRPSATLTDDRLPVETRSTGSVMSWIIGAVVLILIAYFVLQVLF